MSKPKSTIAVFIGIALLAVLAVVGGYYTYKDKICTRTVKDSHNPVLEITLAPSSSEPQQLNESQVKELERGIIEVYNDESGGCSAEYKRWMYGVNVMDQTVTEHAVIKNEAESSISHTFDTEYNLVVRLGTMISCDGCDDDEAFASIYPTTFGSTGSSRRLTEDDGLRADRMFAGFGGIIKQTGLGGVTSMSLITNTGRHSSYYKEGARSAGTKGAKDSNRSTGTKGTKGTKSLGDAMNAVGTKGVKSSGERSFCGKDGSKGMKGIGTDCTVTIPPRAAPGQTPRPTRFVYTPEPTRRPTLPPTPLPVARIADPTPEPTRFVYTPQPTNPPTPEPTPLPTSNPTIPTDRAAVDPTPEPTRFVYTPQPTNQPTPRPTPLPTPNPTPDPTPGPTPMATDRAAADPTPEPTRFVYTPQPTNPPTPEPTPGPTNPPTPFPFQKFTVPPFAEARTCEDDPCQVEFFSNNATESCDPNVQKIVAIDSWCGVRWDPWCVTAYNDCFEETACNAAEIEAVVDNGGVDRSNIKCPEDSTDSTTNVTKGVAPIAETFVEDPTCPDKFPGSMAPCEATNLQCYYAYGDIVWLCNCGAELEFFCRPKDE